MKYAPRAKVRSISERTPLATFYDKEAVCIATACMIATARAMGRKITAINVGYVNYARLIAPYDIRVDPPADDPLRTALATAQIIGLHLAFNRGVDREGLTDEEALLVTSVERLIKLMPIPTFIELVRALQTYVAPGWREIEAA